MLQPVFTLWIEGPLSPLEQLCLRSFVMNGHRVTLYAYGPVTNVPPGVELRDADVVLPAARALHLLGDNPPASLRADLFRLEGLRQGLGLWVDTDVVCLRPIALEGDYIAGWESDDYVNNAVLRLAPDHPVLRELTDAMVPGSLPRWVPFRRAPLVFAKKLLGRPIWPVDLPRGTFGPKGVTAVSRKHGKLVEAQLPEVFYPLHPRQAPTLFQPGLTLASVTTARSLTMHLWNEKIAGQKRQPVPPGSIFAELLERYGAP